MTIYNVYGVTEVSCWASCCEYRPGEPPSIGSALNATTLSVHNGKLVIHGRLCAVDFEFPDEQEGHCTGDEAHVVYDAGTSISRIYVEGRAKPNAMRPSREVESLVMDHYSEVVFARTVFEQGCRFLFLGHADGISKLDDELVLQLLPHNLRPTRIFWNECMPITTNGKLDEEALKRRLRSIYSSNTGRCFVCERFQVGIKNEDTSLRSFGIGSLEVVELAFHLESCGRADGKTSVELIQFLMDERTTFGQLRPFLHDATVSCIVYEPLQAHSADVLVQVVKEPLISELLWQRNLLKCIDTTPVLLDQYVCIGSHAGLFLVCALDTGETLFEIRRPSRIEATCAVHSDIIAFGDYGGVMTLVRPTTGQTIAHVETAGELKTTPVFDADGTLYFGSYDGHFYAYDVSSGRHEMFGANAAGAFLANPLVTNRGVIVAATLRGTILGLNKKERSTRWTLEIEAPIFAGIQQLNNRPECCVVVDVRGTMVLLDILTGKQLSRANTNVTVFASPLVLKNDEILVASESGALLLIEPDGLTVLRRCQLSGGKIVRAPQGHFFEYRFVTSLTVMPYQVPKWSLQLTRKCLVRRSCCL
ncbi:AMP-binding enzyme family protein [Aphelenchoides avenae]|nr:AMP-binding enzyme family protein [Aphelenchus avenae]